MDADTQIVTKVLKENAGVTVALGVALILFGILAIMTPLFTGTAVTIVVGVLMIASGITRGLFAFKTQSFGKGVLMFLLGAVVAIGGVFLLARPLIGLASLTMVLAAFFFADGIIEAIYAFKLRPVKGWGWMLFSGIVSGLLGFLIMYQWPVSGTWAIGVLVGVRLISTGSSVIALGSLARGAIEEVESAVDATA
jgi:uncharacterized membrane protein HdeD (DUF308 family)